MKETTAVFIGHSHCYTLDTADLEATIISLIKNGVTTFLSGGMGEFDRKCAGIVHRLKPRYPHIISCIVIPYLDYKIFNKELFDCSEFPEGLETVPYRAKIIRRNSCMVDMAQSAVCFVTHGYGGAAQTYAYAKRKKLSIINIKSKADS